MKNNADELNALGCESYEKQDLKTALKYWQEASKLGHLEAKYHLANLYYWGEVVKADYKKSSKLFKEVSESGSDEHFVAESQFNLGNAYLKGEGVKQDLAEAYKWYIEAANNGNKVAQFNVGLSLFKGEVLKRNLEAAFKYMFASANAEFENAYFVLGVMYLSGAGCERDVEKAEYWVKKAAEAGDQMAPAMLEKIAAEKELARQENKEKEEKLAELRKNFKSVEVVEDPSELNDTPFVNMSNISQFVQQLEDEEREKTYDVQEDFEGMSFEEVKKMAEAGNSTAQERLSDLYCDGKNGAPKDLDKAFFWAKKSADSENMFGLNTLACLYFDGCGCEKDFEKAIKLYEKAAELGNKKAYYNLGDIYEKGDHVEKDLNKAIFNYEISAALGFAKAQDKLGDLYYNGIGVEQNYEKAFEYYSQAAIQNYAPSLFSLGCCYIDGAGVKQDVFAGLSRLMMSAERDYRPAHRLLHDIYFDGKIVKKDDARALKYLNDLIEKFNDGWAMRKLAKHHLEGAIVEKNVPRAFILFQQAAKAGDEVAQEFLEQLGLGIDEDVVEFLIRYKKK